MPHRPFWYKSILAPMIPYLTVSLGLFVLHSAWAAMFGYHLGMVMILLLAGYKVDFKGIIRNRRPAVILLMMLFGLAGGVLMYLLWPYLNVPAAISDYLITIGLNQNNWPIFLGYFVLVGPALEEIYWRSYLGNTSKKPVVTDFLFAGYHIIVLAGKLALIWLPLILILLALGAWLWRQVNRLNGGLLPSIVSHFTADLAIMLVVFLWIF